MLKFLAPMIRSASGNAWGRAKFNAPTVQGGWDLVDRSLSSAQNVAIDKAAESLVGAWLKFRESYSDKDEATSFAAMDF